MKALGASLSRGGFGYVLTLTVLVIFAGAAGMYAFEHAVSGGPRMVGNHLLLPNLKKGVLLTE